MRSCNFFEIFYHAAVIFEQLEPLYIMRVENGCDASMQL